MLFGVSRQRIHQLHTGIKYGSGLHGFDHIRERVRVRDNHTCQNCKRVWVVGTRRFDVHHLDEDMEGTNKNTGKFKTNYKYDSKNIDKMITYCHKCHLNLDSVRRKIRNGILSVSY